MIPAVGVVSPLIYSFTTAFLSAHNQELFLETSPREMLFGIKFNILDTVTALVRPFALFGLKPSDFLPQRQTPNNTFSLVSRMNETPSKVFEVYSGQQDTQKEFLFIRSYDGKE